MFLVRSWFLTCTMQSCVDVFFNNSLKDLWFPYLFGYWHCKRSNREWSTPSEEEPWNEDCSKYRLLDTPSVHSMLFPIPIFQLLQNWQVFQPLHGSLLDAQIARSVMLLERESCCNTISPGKVPEYRAGQAVLVPWYTLAWVSIPKSQCGCADHWIRCVASREHHPCWCGHREGIARIYQILEDNLLLLMFV